MDFDEMIEVWRTQDKTPAYRVNPDLLRVVVQQEHADLRRESGLDLWFFPWALWFTAGAVMAVVFAMLFVATAGWTTPGVWDYAAVGIAIVTMAVSAGVNWIGLRRQPARESGFGNPLQEKIRNNLSRVDYQVSRYGRPLPSLLVFAPSWVAVFLFAWVVARMDGGAVSWASFFSVVLGMMLPMLWAGRYFRKKLLEHRRRLAQLLDLLDAGE